MKSHFRERVLCAVAAVLLTALSSKVFVAEPANLDRGQASIRVAAIDAGDRPAVALSAG